MAKELKETKATERSSVQTTRWDAIKAEANYLATLHLPYSNVRPPWPKGPGFDCSASCAQLMISAGYNVPYFNTATAPEYMAKGADPSGRLTFWNNDVNGIGGDSVHMFAEIEGRQWGTGGAGNPAWNVHTTEGFSPYHISGLDEPAKIPKNANTNVPGGPGEATGAGAGAEQVESIAKAAAISSFLDFPGFLDSAESESLKGTKSLMNDKSLLPFVEQLATASLRSFMSMPNGNFYAFIPDYFGGLTKRQAYWEIDDIEILSGEIVLSDDALATHVYVVGDTNADQQINWIDQIQTGGVVTVINAFAADFLTGINAPSNSSGETSNRAYETKVKKYPTLADKSKALSFLQRYGARPFYQEAPMIRSHYFEMFLAYQQFCLLWASQFAAKFEFTFMPELFPGGIVKFPSYGIQCYIQEVNHSGSYESGFTTLATLTAPSALPQAGRKYVHSGMVRSAIFEPQNA